ncbi:MAG: hypothetical protein IKS09_06210 [Lachnospiraceae bacterium]|nr:hypothetical protein [Lachnospiraceae bacterium]
MEERKMANGPRKRKSGVNLGIMIGKNVNITFFDGRTVSGILEFTTKFCEEQGWKRPGYYNVNEWSFKKSHVKKAEIIA